MVLTTVGAVINSSWGEQLPVVIFTEHFLTSRQEAEMIKAQPDALSQAPHLIK